MSTGYVLGGTLPKHTQLVDADPTRRKALAALTALLVAVAVIALVFVLNRGDGTAGHQAARGAGAAQSDAGHQAVASTHPRRTAAGRTSAAPSTTAPAPSSSPAAHTTTSSSTASKSASANRTITYTVRPGDNLTVIAAWFHEHGYGALYERNRGVIGDNPNLIHPGQKITISGGTMRVHG